MSEEALKLADWLKQTSELGWAGEHGQRLAESADMIRKLVAELEERTNENTDLRVMIATKFIELDKQTTKADLLENRLRVITGKELDKQGEPVAYVDNRCNDSIEWLVDPLKLDEGTRLYTAPRELSDEEAIKLWDSIPLVPNEGMTGRLKLFARAILKKASEK